MPEDDCGKNFQRIAELSDLLYAVTQEAATEPAFSFTMPLEPTNVVEKLDASHGMVRTELRSSHGDSHLGHLFEDGPPQEGGLRYCINSTALRFVP